MKKVCLLTLFVLFGAASVFAQAPLGKGGAQFNAGVGFSSWGAPIYLGADFGIHRDFTIGPKVSYRNYGYRSLGNNYDQSLIVLGFNGNYHFNNLFDLPSEWNIYAGLTAGYYIWSDIDYIDARGSGIGIDGQIGARYFFTDNFGVNLEFAGGMATGGGVGITYKFK
jgi:outer membrane immunogenic protein